MNNRGIGFYLTLVACALALIDIFVYTSVMYKMTSVFVLLVAVIAVECAAFFLNNKILNEILPIVQGVLLGLAAAHSFYVMVNQIGYVIAALDTVDTITSFIAFVVIALAGTILCWVSGFLKQTNEA